MTHFRTQIFGLGYLPALAVGMFVMSAFELPAMAGSVAMGIPMAMLAGLTWSVASVSRTTVVAPMWLAFAGFATSMLVDWHTWEHLGVVAPVVPLLGGWLGSSEGGPAVAAVEHIRRAA